LENIEENCEKIWKMWKKSKLNSENIGKIWKKNKLNSAQIWKIQKQIVKWYGKYRGKVSWNVKWYDKGGRKLWNDMENVEEK